MDSGRFKKGDRVSWSSGQGQRGLIEERHDCPAWGQVVYVVLFDGPPAYARLIGDSALAPWPEWVPCPGEHRAAAHDGVSVPLRVTDWERRQT